MIRRSSLCFTHSVGRGTKCNRKAASVFNGNSFYVRSNVIRSFSTVPASYAILGLGEPWLRWNHRKRLIPDERRTNSSSDWMITSPNTLQSSRITNLLQRLKEWLQKWWKRLSRVGFITIRTTEVALRLSPLLILAPTAFLSTMITDSSGLTNLAWNYSIAVVQGLGPVAVKFCQWAATRRDIFPPVLCDQLSTLHDNGRPHPRRWTHRVLTESFGDYAEKGLVVDSLIGCGSAAQVYKGRLLEPVTTETTDSEILPSRTREVAIKVLHPRFQEMVDRDLEFIGIVAEALHSLPINAIKMLNLPRAVEEFSVSLRDQADLTIEAGNLNTFRRNFYKNSRKVEDQSSIIFPQPFDGWVSPKAIVEDYVGDAVPIADFLLDSSVEGMDRRKELAGPLLRAFLKMVFVDNFIHGDLHPGNVLVKTSVEPVSPSVWRNFWGLFDDQENQRQGESTTSSRTRTKRSIVFLDAGIGFSLSRNDQKNLIDLFRAVVFNDGQRAGRLMVERAKYERCSQIPGGVEKFAEGIGEIVSEFHDRRKEGLTLGAVRIGALLRRVLDLCRIHGVEIDPAMASVVISTLVLEGLGRSLSPDLDLLTFARPFLMPTGGT